MKRSHSALFHPVPVPPRRRGWSEVKIISILSSLFPRQRRKTITLPPVPYWGNFSALREMLNYFKRQLRQFWGPHWGKAGIEREKESGLKTGKSENMLIEVKKFHGAGLVCVCVCVCRGDLMWWPDLQGACFGKKGWRWGEGCSDSSVVVIIFRLGHSPWEGTGEGGWRGREEG